MTIPLGGCSSPAPEGAGRPWTEAELRFGRRTGRHWHPATHPLPAEFSDRDCPVCLPHEAAPEAVTR